jgi:hypothetical protein
MANQKDIDRAKGGMASWNDWARQCLANNEAPVVDFSKEWIAGLNFEGFIFPGPTIFSYAKIAGGAIFSRAVFHADAKMDRVKFFEDAKFDKVNFKESANFDHAIFCKFADFDCARFQELSMWGAEFEGEVNFANVRFTRAAFTGVSFKHVLTRFTDATFAHVPSFWAATFATPPLFERVSIPYVPDHRANFWRRSMSCAAGADDAARFRRLKQLASDWKDHERELEFFSKELRAKRFYETCGFWPILLSMAYETLSDFGRSIERPIFSLSVLILVAAAIILCKYAPAGSAEATAILGFLVASVFCRVMGQVLFAWLIFVTAAAMLIAWSPTALVLALSNSVPFLGASNWWTNCSASTAFRECELRALPALLAGVQSALSLLLLFLVGLGLRNRFRIG